MYAYFSVRTNKWLFTYYYLLLKNIQNCWDASIVYYCTYCMYLMFCKFPHAFLSRTSLHPQTHNIQLPPLCKIFGTVFWGYLKGVCHEMFDLHFFHDSNPSRPLINRLKYFRLLLQFQRDIRIKKKKNSAVCIPLRSQTRRCASYRGVKLRGVHHTTESSDEKFSKNSAVCISLRSQTAHCGV